MPPRNSDNGLPQGRAETPRTSRVKQKREIERNRPAKISNAYEILSDPPSSVGDYGAQQRAFVDPTNTSTSTRVLVTDHLNPTLATKQIKVKQRVQALPISFRSIFIQSHPFHDPFKC
jgi:hypothetical protein